MQKIVEYIYQNPKQEDNYKLFSIFLIDLYQSLIYNIFTNREPNIQCVAPYYSAEKYLIYSMYSQIHSSNQNE